MSQISYNVGDNCSNSFMQSNFVSTHQKDLRESLKDSIAKTRYQNSTFLNESNPVNEEHLKSSSMSKRLISNKPQTNQKNFAISTKKYKTFYSDVNTNGQAPGTDHGFLKSLTKRQNQYAFRFFMHPQQYDKILKQNKQIVKSQLKGQNIELKDELIDTYCKYQTVGVSNKTDPDIRYEPSQQPTESETLGTKEGKISKNNFFRPKILQSAARFLGGVNSNHHNNMERFQINTTRNPLPKEFPKKFGIDNSFTRENSGTVNVGSGVNTPHDKVFFKKNKNYTEIEQNDQSPFKIKDMKEQEILYDNAEDSKMKLVRHLISQTLPDEKILKKSHSTQLANFQRNRDLEFIKNIANVDFLTKKNEAKTNIDNVMRVLTMSNSENQFRGVINPEMLGDSKDEVKGNIEKIAKKSQHSLTNRSLVSLISNHQHQDISNKLKNDHKIIGLKEKDYQRYNHITDLTLAKIKGMVINVKLKHEKILSENQHLKYRTKYFLEQIIGNRGYLKEKLQEIFAKKHSDHHEDIQENCKIRMRFAEGNSQSSLLIYKRFVEVAQPDHKTHEKYAETILSKFTIYEPPAEIIKQWEDTIIKDQFQKYLKYENDRKKAIHDSVHNKAGI